MTKMNDTPYMPLEPKVHMVEPSDDVANWSASDVKLLLSTVRITAPYTLEELKKMQVFVGLLIEIKEMQ